MVALAKKMARRRERPRRTIDHASVQKYLQQQLADYSFETHFGGVFYLYLRGMSGEAAQDGQSTGVFFDKVDPHYIELLNTLFNASQAEV